jgi:hypothetical protein
MAYSFRRGLTKTQRIAKNIQDMLEIERGTVPFDRDMGVSTAWRHKNRDKYTARMLTEAEDMINGRETRVHTDLSIKDGEIYAEITEVDEG